ncbi:MAG: AAA family ATPase, partial [Longimicrobiales bacterium]
MPPPAQPLSRPPRRLYLFGASAHVRQSVFSGLVGAVAVDAPFLGRDFELERLAGIVDAAIATSAGRAIFVSGHPGMGKTALVGELVRGSLERHPALVVARGRCAQSFASGDPYLPFIAALNDLGDGARAGSLPREAVFEQIRQVAPSWLPLAAIGQHMLGATGAVRRDCAIWLADLAGYTSLASQDEAAALRLVARFQADARQAIDAHGGRLVKFVGDAALAEFADAAA